MTRQSVVLNDMSKCIPGSHLSHEPRFDRWSLISYETPEVSGVAIYLGNIFSHAYEGLPDISLPLNVAGWFAIHLAIWDPSGPPTRSPGHGTYFKLTRDPAPQFICFDLPIKPYMVLEGFWKYAELTDQELVIRQKPGSRAGLAWVRLDPVEAETVRAEKADAPEKIIIAKSDSEIYANPERIAEALSPYPQTDFRKYFITDCMDVQCLRSDCAENIVDRYEDAMENRRLPPNLRRAGLDWSDYRAGFNAQRQSGEDVIDLFAPMLHEMGIQVYAGLRLGAWHPSPPWRYLDLGTRLYDTHPQWRCRDRDGTEIPKMSYAFEGVRDHVVNYYRNLAEKHMDSLHGLTLLFNRGPVFVLYEEPLIEGFRAKTGLDPREVNPEDEDWLRFRAGFVTEFVRSICGMRDNLEKSSGKRLEICANVFSNRAHNLRYGLDLEAWVDENLLDMLIPLEINWPDVHETFEPNFFVDLCGSSGGFCKCVFEVHAGTEELAKRVHGYYQAGVDGVFFWDTEGRTRGLASMNVIRKLGHPEAVRQLAEQEEKAFMPKGSSGDYIEVKEEAMTNGRPGGEYGWWSVPPTRSFLIDKLDGEVVGRYWRDTGL